MSTTSDGSSTPSDASSSSSNGSPPSSRSSGSDPSADPSRAILNGIKSASGDTRDSAASLLSQASSANSAEGGKLADTLAGLVGKDGAVDFTYPDGKKCRIIAADLSTIEQKSIQCQRPGEEEITKYNFKRDPGVLGAENTVDISNGKRTSSIRPDLKSCGLSSKQPERPEKSLSWKPPSDLTQAPTRDPSTWAANGYSNVDRWQKNPRKGQWFKPDEWEGVDRWLVPIIQAASENDQYPTVDSAIALARRLGSMGTFDPALMAQVVLQKGALVGNGINLTDESRRNDFWTSLNDRFTKEISEPSPMPTSANGDTMDLAAKYPNVGGTYYKTDEATCASRRLNIVGLAGEFVQLSGSSWMGDRTYSSDEAFKAAVWATDESHFTHKRDDAVVQEAREKLMRGDSDWITHGAFDLSDFGEPIHTDEISARYKSSDPSLGGRTVDYEPVTSSGTGPSRFFNALRSGKLSEGVLQTLSSFARPIV